MKPKILLICDVRGWGGWERALMIKKYLSDEFDFDLMDNGEFDEFEKKSNQHFIHVNEAINIANKFAAHFTKNQICIPELLKYKKRTCTVSQDYDLYYLMFHTMLCSQQVKRIIYSGGKFISAITGLPVIKEVFDNEKYAPNGATAFKYLANASAGFVVNNMIAFKELKQIYAGPVFYTPRGVDENFWRSYPHHWIWKTEDWKPINTKARPGQAIWNELSEKQKNDYYAKDFTAIFVGKKDSGKGLGTYIQSACSQANIKLITNERNYTNALSKEQMRDFYNEGHVLMVASTTDGTPNPALEAAACGVPVLTNAIGNMPEFIKDGYNGFLVEREVSAYVEKLKWMKKNLDKVQQMGKNARKTIEEGWTWKHSMEYERKALRAFIYEVKK